MDRYSPINVLRQTRSSMGALCLLCLFRCFSLFSSKKHVLCLGLARIARARAFADSNVEKGNGGFFSYCDYIFLLFRTDLKDFPQHSNSPIVSSVLLPLLSFLPAIFQVFLGLLTSFLHLGHLAITLPLRRLHVMKLKDFPYLKVFLLFSIREPCGNCSTFWLPVQIHSRCQSFFLCISCSSNVCNCSGL